VVGKVGYTIVPAGPKDNIRRPAATASHRCQQEQGSGLPALPMGGVEGGRAAAAGRRRRAVPTSILNDPEIQKGVKMPKNGCSRSSISPRSASSACPLSFRLPSSAIRRRRADLYAWAPIPRPN
jgi:hypothetical protein